jgi:hypothetical protein
MQLSQSDRKAIEAYFTGVTKNAGNLGVQLAVREMARRGKYNDAHRITQEEQLTDPNNDYGKYKDFPIDLFLRRRSVKQEIENGAIKSMKDIHPAAKTVGLSIGSLRHVANEAWDKLDKESLLKIADAVAKHGLDNKTYGRPFDSSDLVQYARKQTQGAQHSEEEKTRRSLTLLHYGLRKDLAGTDRDPEEQRRQDMQTDFYRKPNTYLGRHPKHNQILQYFDHYSQPLSSDARTTILHDATIGEYGSAQRKLARRNDKLPAGLDGLKFGDSQIEMIQQLAKEGIFNEDNL